MGSALGYALTGAAAGLGDDIMRRAEDKRAMARELLKQQARTAERAEDRENKLFDTAAENERADTVYTRGLGDKREDAALLRGEQARARGAARSQTLLDRAEGRKYKAGLLGDEREQELADRKLEREQELADLEAKLKRNKELDAAQRDRALKALKAKQDREDKALEKKREQAVEDRDVKESGLKAIKSADSNAIARAVGTAFGGFYDPVNGTFSGLDPDTATRALSIMGRAEEIWAEAQASGKPIGHRAAANQAMNEAKADSGRGGDGSGDENNPLGLKF